MQSRIKTTKGDGEGCNCSSSSDGGDYNHDKSDGQRVVEI